MSFEDVVMAERTDLGHRLSLYIHPSEEDQHFEKQEREAECWVLTVVGLGI